MAGMSDTLEQNVLKWLTKQTALPTAPTTLFVSLHSADPSDTGASEISGNNYSRAQLNPDPGTNVNWNALDTSGTATRVTNKNDVVFPQATPGAWNSGSAIPFFGIWDASTSGNFLWGGAFSGTGVTVNATVTLRLVGGNPGQLQLTAD